MLLFLFTLDPHPLINEYCTSRTLKIAEIRVLFINLLDDFFSLGLFVFHKTKFVSFSTIISNDLGDRIRLVLEEDFLNS
jgi:hypothetical protein